MKHPELRFSVIGILMLFICAACSSGKDDDIGVTTRWLGPLHQYERLSGKDRFGVFLKKDALPPATVRQLRIAPVEITISAGSDLNALNPASYEQLRAAFSEPLKEQVARRFPAPTEKELQDGDTYVLRAALANLTVKRKTTQFGSAELKDLEFATEDTAVEISFREMRTNIRRAVIVQKITGGKISWNGLRERIKAVTMEAATKVAEARDGINKKANQPKAPPAKDAAPNKQP
jgi:hypothetical protein